LQAGFGLAALVLLVVGGPLFVYMLRQPAVSVKTA